MWIMGCLYAFLFMEPELITLNLVPVIRDVIVEDINHDNKKDLIVFSSEEDGYEKKIIIFYQQSETPKFNEKFSFSFQIKEPCSVIFITKIGNEHNCLVIANSENLCLYRFKDNEMVLERTVTYPNAFSYNAKEPVVMRDMSYDLDNDGTDEWFIPTPRGVTIFKNFTPLSEIDFHIFHEIYSGNNMTLFYQFPVIYPLKKSQENPKPVAFLGDKEIVFAYGENWKLTKTIKIDRKNPEKWDSTYRLGDINNDGFPDILFTETQGTINLRTTLYIYISEGEYQYPANPQFEYTIKGAVSLPIMKDINNNNKDDLILFNIPLGLTNFINFFLRGKMSVETKVFLSDSNSLPLKPDYQTTMTMDAPDGKDQIAYAIDDFSGDGILDIAYGQSHNTIQINIGLQEGNLKTKQWTKVNIPAFGIIRTSYINDNKSKDIIIYRPTGENKERVDIILF